MADDDNNKRQVSQPQVIIAIIGLVGIVATALFGNWDKLFLKQTVSTIAENTKSKTESKLAEVKFNVYAQDYQPIEFVEIRFIFDGAPST